MQEAKRELEELKDGGSDSEEVYAKINTDVKRPPMGNSQEDEGPAAAQQEGNVLSQSSSVGEKRKREAQNDRQLNKMDLR